jgi:hypothetical protein
MTNLSSWSLDESETLYGKQFNFMRHILAFILAAILAFVLCGALSIGEDVRWGLNRSLDITYQNYPIILLKSLLKLPLNLCSILQGMVTNISKFTLSDLDSFLLLLLSILAVSSTGIATYYFRHRTYFSVLLLFLTLLGLFAGAIFLNAMLNQLKRFG